MGEDSEDPLELKNLSLSFDYLTFKIKDHLSGLAEMSYQSILNKEKLIKEKHLEGELGLQEQLEELDEIIKKCSEIEMSFLKLEQLGSFVEDFKKRLEYIESEFTQLV